MANDRRQTPRLDSTERRQPGNQFGRSTGAFSEVVNAAFATLRRLEREAEKEAR